MRPKVTTAAAPCHDARAGAGDRPAIRVLGVDPGIAATGYGLVAGQVGAADTAQLIDYGVVRTEASDSMTLRLVRLHEALADLIRTLRPDVMAVEQLFFARNVSTALTVGQSRGIVLLTAGQAGLTVHEYSPREIKLALTGYGDADKRQVQHMLGLLLQLPTVPQPDDAADAVAVALCHLQSARLRALQ